MSCRWEATHVESVLRNQNLGRAALHPGNGVEQGDRLIERAYLLLNLLAKGFDLIFQIVQVGKNPADQKGLMGSEPAGQGLL